MENRSALTLNVFDFPSETNTRFFLLILAALFFAVNTGQNIGRTFSVMTEKTGIISGDPEYSTPYPGPPDNNGNLRSYEENIQYNKEVFVNTLKSLSFQMFFVVLLFATAYSIYRTYPKRIVRKNKLKPFDYSDDEQFYRSVYEISTKTGTLIPQAYSGASYASTTAQAFGYSKRNFLRIDSGLRILLRKSKGLYDAVMLHEFGHIINKDIFKTYFTQSLWYSCLIVFALPLLISTFMNFFSGISERMQTETMNAGAFLKIFTVSIPALIKVLIMYAALFSVIAYTRSALLRTREFYADQRAVQFGAADGLMELFKKSPAVNVMFLKKIFMLHPDTNKRMDAVRDNSILFRMKGELPFITGLLIAVTMNGLFYPFMSFLLFVSSIFGFGAHIDDLKISYLVIMMGFMIPALHILLLGFFISLIISGTVGIQIIKDSLSNKNNDMISKLKKYFITSLLFVLGNEIGFLIIPFSSIVASNAGAFLLLILLQIFFAVLLVFSLALIDNLGIRALRSASSGQIRSRLKMVCIVNSLCLSLFVVLCFSARIYIVQNF